MRIIRFISKIIIFFLCLIIGAKALDVNRTIGTCLLVITAGLPLWSIFLKNRIDRWWALIPAWLLPAEVLLILKLEGGMNELLGTLVLLAVASPFAIWYIIKHRKLIHKMNILTHSLLGTLMFVGLILLYLVAWSMTPFSGVARNLYYGGAYVGDWKHFPSRTAMNKDPVYLFNPAVNGNPDELSDQYLEIVYDTLPDSKNHYNSLEDFLKSTDTTSFLVIRDDAILYEWYGNGYNRDSIVTSFSVAKSFVSALIGFAIEDGYIHSVEDPITDYIPELLHRDSRFREITIRHLLTMTSGLKYVKDGPPWGDDMRTYYAIDLRKSALSVEIEKKPGEEFLYNNYNPLLLGLILERATGRSATEYLEEKIWQPLGMEAPCTWSMDSEKSGFEKMQVGINARAIDFAKFGKLYLDQGNWKGKQLLSADWISKSTSKEYQKDLRKDYLYAWWSLENGFAAIGAFGQYICVFPDQKMIVLRFGTASHLGDVWEDIFTGIAKE